MRNKIIFILLISLHTMSYAQMPVAKKIEPKAQKSIKINASFNDVWNYILKFDNIDEYGSKFVKSCNSNGSNLDDTRNVILINGEKREEQLIKIIKDTKGISSIGIRTLSKKKGFQHYFYYYEIKVIKENKTKVYLKAYYDLEEGVKSKKINKQISNEFNDLLKGLKLNLEK